MPDLHKTGEKKIYYRLKTNQHIDFNQFIHKLHHSNNGISEADAIRVLLSAADQLAEWNGKQVTADLPTNLPFFGFQQPIYPFHQIHMSIGLSLENGFRTTHMCHYRCPYPFPQRTV